ncbi:hypothetical protein HanIR_Chr13g0632851 [Helianthus annuus]|nr:hypothetical protein HanIR_Chr13g0632851 [Helianthus annuus]
MSNSIFCLTLNKLGGSLERNGQTDDDCEECLHGREVSKAYTFIVRYVFIYRL